MQADRMNCATGSQLSYRLAIKQSDVPHGLSPRSVFLVPAYLVRPSLTQVEGLLGRH
jgi:hypothetical protein